MVTAVILIAGSMIALVKQDQVFSLLMAFPGFVVSIVWITICLAQLKLRRSYPFQPSFKIWGYPFIPIFTVICLAIISISFLFDEANRISIMACLACFAVVIFISIFKFQSNKR